MPSRRKNISKRSIPTPKVLDRRRANLVILGRCEPNFYFENAPLLEPGNSKIGQESNLYQRVLVWNIPAIKTCPGASAWCKSHCYNGDDITNKYPASDWAKNYTLFLNDPEWLRNELISILSSDMGKIAVRIHSSGDFFSIDYITFWHSIIKSSPHSKFWAYTRSWSIPFLFPYLEKLRTLENIQLFASWDKTMPPPPTTWRKSIVYLPNEIDKLDGLVCPEQSGLLPNCASCDYCIAKPKGNVYFILH